MTRVHRSQATSSAVTPAGALAPPAMSRLAGGQAAASLAAFNRVQLEY
jgi:hypothetical protein